MKLGIFAKTFERPSVEAVFEAVRAHGLNVVQFNLSCAGLPSLPDEIDPAVTARVHAAALRSGVEIAAVSGTYNMIHPDPQIRQHNLRRLRTLAHACRDLGTSVITLCTGTRDPADMWRWHPQNAAPEAWSDLLQAMEAALVIAEEAQVTLAFEPERANVIYTAQRGRELLTAMQSPRLKVVIDGANLIIPGGERSVNAIMDEAFALLGEHLIMAHAKDRGADDKVRSVGEGIMDFEHYLGLLRAHGFAGPLIMHGMTEVQVPDAVRFLRGKLGSE
jgi:sugar phosphate isomerase/epimerase